MRTSAKDLVSLGVIAVAYVLTWPVRAIRRRGAR